MVGSGMQPALIGLLVAFTIALALFARRARRIAREARREIDALRVEEAAREEEAERRRQYFEENDVSRSANQLRFIASAELRAVCPVNKEASRVLYALDEWVRDQRPDWRLSFEVAMGAFVKTAYDPSDRRLRAAFSSFNSKRVDFLLIDRFGQPRLVVEYHGTGHDLSEDAADRMAVKRLVLERVGIPLVEVPAGAGKAEILRLLTDGACAEAGRPDGAGPRWRR
ncbi:DUF2726 domain-containing protein [Aureimonas sp. AU20]|uniref:DUF2726 domain-containing protein n=2 Tax=Aureimonas sp. AU20 TaxID=1349819 RepID=UPI000B1D4222|nr:DUF2726 domain-containing protein [Aureimonas sp. AU20]